MSATLARLVAQAGTFVPDTPGPTCKQQAAVEHSEANVTQSAQAQPRHVQLAHTAIDKKRRAAAHSHQPTANYGGGYQRVQQPAGDVGRGDDFSRAPRVRRATAAAVLTALLWPAPLLLALTALSCVVCR
jgi:hypothetical protein